MYIASQIYNNLVNAASVEFIYSKPLSFSELSDGDDFSVGASDEQRVYYHVQELVIKSHADVLK